VLLYTEENMYSFRVRETRVVSEAEMSVIEPTTNSQITLITCTNYDTVTGYYLDRLIIMADLLTVVPLENKTQGN
jgi:LPXTG-site transpeptidase (sortase) family protein